MGGSLRTELFWRDKSLSEEGAWLHAGKNSRYKPHKRLRWKSRFYWAEDKLGKPLHGQHHRFPAWEEEERSQSCLEIELVFVVSKENCWYGENREGKTLRLALAFTRYICGLVFSFMIWVKDRSGWVAVNQAFRNLSRGFSWSTCLSGHPSSLSDNRQLTLYLTLFDFSESI